MTETATQTKACSACANWNQTAGSEGECRARAPQAVVFNVDEETKFETRFPVTQGDDWCGEFKQK